MQHDDRNFPRLQRITLGQTNTTYGLLASVQAAQLPSKEQTRSYGRIATHDDVHMFKTVQVADFQWDVLLYHHSPSSVSNEESQFP